MELTYVAVLDGVGASVRGSNPAIGSETNLLWTSSTPDIVRETNVIRI